METKNFEKRFETLLNEGLTEIEAVKEIALNNILVPEDQVDIMVAIYGLFSARQETKAPKEVFKKFMQQICEMGLFAEGYTRHDERINLEPQVIKPQPREIRRLVIESPAAPHQMFIGSGNSFEIVFVEYDEVLAQIHCGDLRNPHLHMKGLSIEEVQKHPKCKDLEGLYKLAKDSEMTGRELQISVRALVSKLSPE